MKNKVNKQKQNKTIEVNPIRQAVLVLRAVNHKLRQEIINFLIEKEFSFVSDIYIKFRVEQSVVSAHLAILRNAGIVQKRRQGKYIYYSVDNERYGKLMKDATELITYKTNEQ